MTATDRYLKFNEIRGAGHRVADALYVVRQMRMAEEVGGFSSSPLSPPRPYPEAFVCGCEEDGVTMERQTACDIPGETPAERYERGCNECFVCPKCKFQELFPFPSMTVADMRRLYPGWGRTRNAGHGEAA